ncbi:hypothetical protein CAPTEDRAFT_171816 [Capitella teleta]|uniref:Peroxisomal carnitine O-octanoyltransferase n=1 Tax=Capitella teleta TaxID=283909 RepID=R7VG40_CAPTE|nr:hypothetical protein CAPTEDRAFT_171816 [Capitella teleta]|eukprot:ELU17808.1 hypothetical protein CAPTEDRAFT_171816 [Capitella teleta]
MYLSKGEEKTFQYQDSLPSLPIPDLEHTLAKYLESVQPFLTKEEYAKTELIVKDFGQGIGRKLQIKLLEKSKHKRNWVEKWWEDLAYLSLRTPHSPFLNFTGPAPYSDSKWPPLEGSQIERASLIVWFSLRYWETLRKEKLRVDRGSSKTVWCMHQYKRMFSGCKTPGVHVDKLNDYFKTEREGPTPTHLLVLCKGRLFTMDVLDAQGQLKTAPEIRAALQIIRDTCDRQMRGPGIGSLTAGNRESWFKLREHLIQLDEKNARYLELIQTAIMGLSLDESSPDSMSGICQNGLLGDSSCRWFDKSLTFIIYKNGTVACNCDHSAFDGMMMVTILHYLSLLFSLYDLWKGPSTVRNFPPPVEMDFKIDSKITSGILEAQKLFKNAEESLDIEARYFSHYGKKYIRGFKLHPDAFVQVALQLAYYRLYNKFAPTYETATTRKFFHGRTETVRSCTNETVAFCKAMTNPEATSQKKYQLLMQAMKKHIDNMGDCMEAKGCDRHLFGLSVIAMEEGIAPHEIYTDKAFTKSGGGGNYILSTSFVGYTPVFGGVAPMCKDGYGCFYSIQPEQMSVFVSSWKADEETSSAELHESLSQSLLEIKHLLDTTAPPKL